MNIISKHKRISKAITFFITLTLVLTLSMPIVFAEDKQPNSSGGSSIPKASAIHPQHNNAKPSEHGFVDRGIDFSKVNDYSYKQASSKLRTPKTLPTSYSYKGTRVLTPVRDQGYYGDCWAFASTASASGSLVENDIVSSAITLSAKQLAYATYNKDTFATSGYTPLENGGDFLMATAAMSKWFGPVRETTSPEPNPTVYDNPGTGENPWTMALSYYEVSDYHLEDMYIFPAPYGSYNTFSMDNINAVKLGLQTYGPLGTSYYAGDPATDYSASYAYFTTGTNAEEPADHGVTIVGWDDNFPTSNFLSPPPGNGAWLIQNSWNETWGNDGYFWLSYYEATMGESYFFSAFGDEDYDEIDYYDELGWIGDEIQMNSSASLYAANIFSIDGSTKVKELSGASFYTDAPGLSYTVSAYANPTSANPASGTLLSTVSGTATYAGYHTVNFPSKVRFLSAEKYSIVVKTTAPSGQTINTIPAEGIYNNGDHLTLSAGQSFVSSNGTSWTDVKTLYAGNAIQGMGNVNVRALISGSEIGAIAIGGAPATYQYNANTSNTVKLTATVTPSGATYRGLDWSVSGPATVDQSGNLSFTGAEGTVSVTVKSSSDTTKYTVANIRVVKHATKIRTPLSTVYMKKGTSYSLPVVVDDGNKQISAGLTWTSSNAKVVTVSSSGRLSAKNVKKKTKATVTATAANGTKMSVSVYVVPQSKSLSKLNVSGAPTKMKAGAVNQLRPKLSSSAATNITVTHSSSKSSIIAVDKAGKIYALKKGTATITVKAGKKKWTKKITVV